MNDNERTTEEKQKINNGPSRRAFMGAVGGIAGFAMATAGASEFLEAAAISWPEANPLFAGVPSQAFLQSGQPLTSAGLQTPMGTKATATTPSSAEVWAASVPTFTSPNILMIIVDQLWNNLWLPDDANGNPSTAAIDTYTPTLAFLRDNSVRFLNYYVAACQCTPSRGAMFTGLYSHQTNLLTTQGRSDSPQLQQGFSTFGNALQDSIFGSGPLYNGASPYAGNVYYCGKWHMLQFAKPMTASSLTSFGFSYVPVATNHGLQPPSPDGIPNEGQQTTLHGYDCDAPSCPAPGDNLYWGSDGDIASAAVSKLDALKTSTNPWCVVASFVNPHDIGVYPAYFSTPANGTGSWTANGFTPEYPYFSPNGSFLSLNPGGSPPYTQNPSHWNNVDPLLNPLGGYNGKPTLQSTFEIKQDFHQQAVSGNDSSGYGPWVDFFNNYVWLQSLVDAQIGAVRAKLAEFSDTAQQNTVIIFTTDHGDYCGSHTMHSKGGAVYEEAINVPLYLLLPTGPGAYYQAQTSFLCSAVDLFGLVVELATGNGAWKTKAKYKDLANRQSILYKIYHPDTSETRVFTTGSPQVSVPYILHTTDEPFSPEYNPANSEAYAQLGSPVQNHVACIRTKTSKILTQKGQIIQSSSGFPYAGKFAAYDYWPLCQITPGSLATQYEFYDFTNVNAALGVINFTEIGNQAPQTSGGPGAPTYCPASSPTPTQALFCTLAGVAYGSSGSNGLFATELAAALTGKATDGVTSLSSLASQALNVVKTTGPTGYFDYLNQIYGGTKCGS